MKDAPTRVISSKRSSPLLHKAALRNKTNSKTNKISPVQDEAPTSVDDSLAICLFGLSRTMYDSEYEEEVRKQAVMSVSLVYLLLEALRTEAGSRRSCPTSRCGRNGKRQKHLYVKGEDGTPLL